MNNEKNNSLDKSALNDYEIDIEHKRSFLDLIIDNFNRSKQKLLPSSNTDKVRTTSKSIYTLWGLGNFRALLLNTIENIHTSVFKPKTPEIKNSFNTEVIGNPQNPQEYTKQVSVPEKKLYIPHINKTQKQKATNISTDKTSITGLEISDIDTSAIPQSTVTVVKSAVATPNKQQKNNSKVAELDR